MTLRTRCLYLWLGGHGVLVGEQGLKIVRESWLGSSTGCGVISVLVVGAWIPIQQQSPWGCRQRLSWLIVSHLGRWAPPRDLSFATWEPFRGDVSLWLETEAARVGALARVLLWFENCCLELLSQLRGDPWLRL